MASLRSSLTLLRKAARQGCRPVSTQSSASKKAAPLVVVGAVATTAAVAGFAGYEAYRVWGLNPRAVEEAVKAVQEALSGNTVSAAALPDPQPSVYTPDKIHALYLWIHLKPTAKVREVARVMAKLQKYVDEVCGDPNMTDEDDEIVAGVGFGPNFYCQVVGKTKEDFTYLHRKGNLGQMPSTGGDVFVHAKSQQVGKLFELGQVILKNLPKDNVDKFEDIYSFDYRNHRDLSGFIDGTENPADEDDRKDVAVEKSTGGSYVITQKWIHDLNLLGTEKDKTLESWVGRSRQDSTELARKTITSHVARMTGSNTFQQPKPVQMVRQSMPFGTLSGEAGLFFIGYAASPYNLEYMLDRMVGAGADGHCDDIMRLSKNVTGTYWYFPGVAQLKKME